MGGVYVLEAALARIGLLIALYYGLVQVGRGLLRCMLYPITFCAVLLLLRLNMRTPEPGVQSFYVTFFIAGAIVHGWVALVYHFSRRAVG
jgi:hypothetical protein